MFYTEQELLAQIKGWEYIIAILFLGLFMAFWWVMGRGRRQRRTPEQAGSTLLRGRRGGPATRGEGACIGYQPRAEHCWESRRCPPEARERCPGYVMSPLPCWVARGLVDGQRWEPCTTCPVYAQGMERLVRAASRGAGGDAFPQAPAA